MEMIESTSQRLQNVALMVVSITSLAKNKYRENSTAFTINEILPTHSFLHTEKRNWEEELI